MNTSAQALASQLNSALGRLVETYDAATEALPDLAHRTPGRVTIVRGRKDEWVATLVSKVYVGSGKLEVKFTTDRS